MRKNVSEKDVRKAVRGLLKQFGFLIVPYVPGFYGVKGVADLLCVGTVQDIPGKFIAIELKKPGGKPTQAQLDFLQAVREKGGIAFIAESTQDVIRHLHLPVLF